MRRRALGVALVLAPVAALAFAGACDPDVTRVGAGGECFLASDCEPGLVCVPQRNGSRVCSSDLTQVTGRPPATQDAAPREGGGEGGDASGEQDTGVPDTGGGDTGVDTGIGDAGADG